MVVIKRMMKKDAHSADLLSPGQLKCAGGDKEACKYWQSPVLQQFSQPVVLQVRISQPVVHEGTVAQVQGC